MRRSQQIAAVILCVLAVFTIYGIWETRRPRPSGEANGKNSPGALLAPAKAMVDQSPLKTAQQLAQLATSQAERALAQEALRLADYEVDLAFDTALREARLHPPAMSPEAKENQDRLQKAEKLLTDDQEHAKQIAEQVVKAPATKKESLESDLIQTEADLDLDQDELDDAKQDLIRAGGDPIGRIQALKKEHEEAEHGAVNTIPSSPAAQDQFGLIHRVQQWTVLHQLNLQLWAAKQKEETAAALLEQKHNALDASIELAKESQPELAHHAKKNKAKAPPGAAPAADKSHNDSESLLHRTEQISADQKTLAGYDKRIETQNELAGVYGQWIELVSARQRAVIHRALLGVAFILGIALIGILISSWMNRLVNQLSVDRRQIQSLHTVARISLQFVVLLVVLLQIFGPPGQLGTFLGLAGAGLTVALKDFIVGFIGWFVLMGKNGIRLGDWVEINGVTGEVVEIGPFHTVLFETGNWTDSGHPTGRRVTFTNSYAIEGHYFNFSTTGQWLWDELQIVLPAGQDPYPIVDAIHKKVSEATVENARQAEEEWKGSTTSREMSGFSADPAISVKPVAGGIEIAVRYITRANERYALRSKLNRAAVELLGGKPGQPSPS